MKYLKYLSIAALAAIIGGCSEEPELPPIYQFSANTTIQELKEAYWQTDANYVATVGLTSRGEHTVFKGRVISSDESGNIYKSMMVSDGTAAITIAVNKTGLYKNYRLGQEVLVDATYLKIGGYNGLMQLGGEGTYNGAPSMTFMASDSLGVHVHQTGTPDPEAVKPTVTTISELANAKSTAAGLMAWQSRLVTIEGLTFENAGQPFAPNSSNTNRYAKDASGQRINIRCSGYATFASQPIPSGRGSVTAILSYYGSDWQLLLNGLDGLQGFDGGGSGDEPAPGDAGSKEKPYSVSEVIGLGNPGKEAWVSGYIVGVMNYDEAAKANVFSSSDLTTNSNIVLAAKKADYGTELVAVQLPAGALREQLNLVDNPLMLGKEATFYGSLEKYCGIAGVKYASAAVVDGKEIGSAPSGGGDGKAFTRASAVTTGEYALWTDNTVGLPMAPAAGKDYAYLPVATANLGADGTLTTAPANAYTFTETAKGWTIHDSNGLYLYMKESFQSFQLAKEPDESNDGFYWSVTVGADGRAEIVNKLTDNMVQYSSKYRSYGCYTDRTTGSKPYLYQSAK